MLTKMAAVGLIATGIAGVALPAPLSKAFGAPLDDDGSSAAFVRATSVRDIAIGALMLSAAASGERNTLRVASLCGAGISFSDFLSTKRPIHIAGAALFLVMLAMSRDR